MQPKLNRRLRSMAQLAAIAPLCAFVAFASLLPALMDQAPLRVTLDWVPSLGITLAFLLDGLSVLFCLIISGIGFLIAVYAFRYFDANRRLLRFYVLFYLFMAAMLGLVLADDLLLLFVFWEVTTLISFLLIGFEPETSATRRNARQALLVTGAGGLGLLLAILLIGREAGTYSIQAVTHAGLDWRQTPFYPLLLAALFLGAFTKSAQFPFHFWLPNAMSAPTPISAFLHSATMVKAGIYLLARMHPVFGGTVEWMATLVIVGGVTALVSSVLALGRKDMKKVLAYTTVMALGLMTMFLGGRTTPTLTAAVTFLLVHALYKSGLFLVVGIIDHETGTRDLNCLGGLFRRMPLTGLAAFSAAASMAGFPLFLGFIGKEIMYKGALTEPIFPGFAATAAVLSNAMMTAVAAFITIDPFLRSRAAPPAPKAIHEAPAAMWAGPLVLGATGLVFGIFPEWVGEVLIEPAVTAFHLTTDNIQLKLWHGVNVPLLLSLVTLVLGGLLFHLELPVRRLEQTIGRILPLNLDRAYDALLSAVVQIAERQTRWIQSGSLYAYLSVIFVTFVLILSAALFRCRFVLPDLAFSQVDTLTIILAAAMTAATVAVVRASSYLLAICALGAVGAGAALLFMANGAPDVALTQLLVETLTLVFVALVLLRLPRLHPREVRFQYRQVPEALVAAAAGLGVTLLLLVITQYPLDRSVTAFYEANSLVAAYGRNVVNVILVDFRGFDTLGEIIVVAVAGLAGFALVRGRRSQ